VMLWSALECAEKVCFQRLGLFPELFAAVCERDPLRPVTLCLTLLVWQTLLQKRAKAVSTAATATGLLVCGRRGRVKAGNSHGAVGSARDPMPA
jgi:hypothetical protein